MKATRTARLRIVCRTVVISLSKWFTTGTGRRTAANIGAAVGALYEKEVPVRALPYSEP